MLQICAVYGILCLKRFIAHPSKFVDRSRKTINKLNEYNLAW